MIGPVYGDDNDRVPNGIIQFINKKGDQPINESDKKKFNEIA